MDSDDKCVLSILYGSLLVILSISIPVCNYFDRRDKLSKLEDRTAVASFGVVRNPDGYGVGGYVALDKDLDGEIDEIKRYSYITISSRAGSGDMSLIDRYHWDDEGFEILRKKYFSNVGTNKVIKTIIGNRK